MILNLDVEEPGCGDQQVGCLPVSRGWRRVTGRMIVRQDKALRPELKRTTDDGPWIEHCAHGAAARYLLIAENPAATIKKKDPNTLDVGVGHAKPQMANQHLSGRRGHSRTCQRVQYFFDDGSGCEQLPNHRRIRHGVPERGSIGREQPWERAESGEQSLGRSLRRGHIGVAQQFG